MPISCMALIDASSTFRPWYHILRVDGEYKQRWQNLCKLVADEKDPVRFSELVSELLDELRKKEERLTSPPKSAAADD